MIDVDEASKSKRNDFGFHNARLFCLCYPRAIQIRQKIDLQRNLLAEGLAVSSLGKSIQERHTKNSVAPYATTLYVPLRLVSSDTTFHVVK